MDENPAHKVFAYRWLIFGIMALAYVFVYFHRLSPAVVAVDLQKTFETSGGFMGLLIAYFTPTHALPAGLLADSLGPARLSRRF
jgi:sugar phosphate permease